MKIITKEQARRLGLRRYYTGEECVNGHVSERRVSDDQCYECRREQKKRYREKYKSCLAGYLKEYREMNKDRTREIAREYKKKRRDYFNFYDARRRARKLDQTCKCCTNKGIYEIYSNAYSKGHEVDHVVPLSLGGLHCRHNLQILTPEEHREKTRRDISEISRT